MYISMANPGSSASFQMMFAEYARGTRIDGASSNPVPGSKTAGNASLIGSWWIPQPGQWSVQEGNSWAPRDRMDMMDADRAIRTEGDGKEFGQWPRFFYVAERHGLLRIYTHNKDLSASDSSAAFLDWLDDDKTNYSLENWKATDGEAASYVYGRWSTDVHLDEGKSDATKTVLKISRQDPTKAGYWRVPVTISINVSGKNPVEDIEIVEGKRVLKASDGSLKDLDGKRIMDVGYDIRGDKLYVSYFWNASSILSVSFKNKQAVSAASLSEQQGALVLSGGGNSIEFSPIIGLSAHVHLGFDAVYNSHLTTTARFESVRDELSSAYDRWRNYPIGNY